MSDAYVVGVYVGKPKSVNDIDPEFSLGVLNAEDLGAATTHCIALARYSGHVVTGFWTQRVLSTPVAESVSREDGVLRKALEAIAEATRTGKNGHDLMLHGIAQNALAAVSREDVEGGKPPSERTGETPAVESSTSPPSASPDGHVSVGKLKKLRDELDHIPHHKPPCFECEFVDRLDSLIARAGGTAWTR